MRANPAIEEVVVPGVLPGFKIARIVATTNGFAFRGIGLGGEYLAHDLAVCVYDRGHVPPVGGCGCGFYALKDRDAAAWLGNDVGIALLDVDLWGRFHEFEKGFVAAVQQVRRVTLLPCCIRCLYGRTHELTPARVLTGGQGQHGELVPVCADHLPADLDAVTPAELAEAFDVEVVWADADDPLVTVAAEIAKVLLPRRRPEVRRLDDLLPGETAYAFQPAVAVDDDGGVWIDALARLVQPLPGTDVPLRLGDDGVVELLLDEVLDFDGWRPRRDPARFELPTRPIGCPQPRDVTEVAA